MNMQHSVMTQRDWPLKYNGPGAWAIKSDQGKILTNADPKAQKGQFGVGDRVLEVEWVNQNGWIGWVSTEYMKIPVDNGLAKSGLYTFGNHIKMEVTNGIVTGLWKETKTDENGKDN